MVNDFVDRVRETTLASDPALLTLDELELSLTDAKPAAPVKADSNGAVPALDLNELPVTMTGSTASEFTTGPGPVWPPSNRKESNDETETEAESEDEQSRVGFRKKLPIWLFIAGLVAEAAGFVIDKPEAFPVVAYYAYPSYVRGVAGLSTLQAGQELLPEMEGFALLARLYVIDSQYPGIGFLGRMGVGRGADEIVKSLVPGGGGIGCGPASVVALRPITVTVASGDTHEWSVDEAMRALQRAQRIRLTGVAALVFSFGVALQIAGFKRSGKFGGNT